jgi:DNA-binding response OmpR family regulator
MATRVLVVEDDPDIRDALAEALESQGYEVDRARDGADALRVARARVPDVILLDLMMPVMNGWAFRAAQRGDRALADIPVIVISAVDPDRLGDLAVDACICKPFALEELFAALARLEAGGPAEPRHRESGADAPGGCDA